MEERELMEPVFRSRVGRTPWELSGRYARDARGDARCLVCLRPVAEDRCLSRGRISTGFIITGKELICCGQCPDEEPGWTGLLVRGGVE